MSCDIFYARNLILFCIFCLCSGQLKIAEVESRFDDIKKFIENVRKCGFEMENKDLSNNLFYFINFKKNRSIDKIKNSVPDFSLKPCLYKKR